MPYLYLIRCKEFLKIGIANDVGSRIASLQTGNPYKLELIDAYQFDNPTPVEQSLHQRFAQRRANGEWFTLTDADVQLAGQICALLGGVKSGAPAVTPIAIDDEADAEQPDTSDFYGMIADNWRVEVTNRGRYFMFRRGTKEDREYCRGGKFEDLPEEYKKAYYDRRIVNPDGEPKGQQ